jgi:hypothetical protein
MASLVDEYVRDTNERYDDAAAVGGGDAALIKQCVAAIARDFKCEVEGYIRRRATTVGAAAPTAVSSVQRAHAGTTTLDNMRAAVDDAAVAASVVQQFPAAAAVVQAVDDAVDDALFRTDDALDTLRSLRSVVERSTLLNEAATRATHAKAFAGMAHVRDAKLLLKGVLNPKVIAIHDANAATVSAVPDESDSEPVSAAVAAASASQSQSPSALVPVPMMPLSDAPSTSAAPIGAARTASAGAGTASAAGNDAGDIDAAAATNTERARRSRASVLNTRVPRLKEAPPPPRTPLGVITSNTSPTPNVVRKILRGSSVRRNAPASAAH